MQNTIGPLLQTDFNASMTEKYHHIQCLRPKNVAKQCAQEQSQ